MAIFNQFPWTNFREYNLDWIISKVKALTSTVDDLNTTVENALTDVSDAVSDYFTTHIDSSLTRSGDAADAAVVGQRLTTTNNNITSLTGQVGALNTSVGNLTNSLGLKANAVVIDADNLTYLQGSYDLLWTNALTNNKAVDVWIVSSNIWYRPIRMNGGPNSRVILYFKYSDNRIHSIGCDSDNSITGINTIPENCVIFDVANNTTLYYTPAGCYSLIKNMYNNYGPYDIIIKISDFDQAIPYDIWFNGADRFKLTYRNSSDAVHTLTLQIDGTITIV